MSLRKVIVSLAGLALACGIGAGGLYGYQWVSRQFLGEAEVVIALPDPAAPKPSGEKLPLPPVDNQEANIQPEPSGKAVELPPLEHVMQVPPPPAVQAKPADIADVLTELPAVESASIIQTMKHPPAEAVVAEEHGSCPIEL